MAWIGIITTKHVRCYWNRRQQNKIQKVVITCFLNQKCWQTCMLRRSNAYENLGEVHVQYLSWLIYLWKKTNNLSIMVFLVSILVRLKLPSRVRWCLQKVSFLNRDNLWTLTLVWRIKRPEYSWFLAMWLVEIDSFSTFRHAVKRPLLLCNTVGDSNLFVSFLYYIRNLEGASSADTMCGVYVWW